MDDGDSAMPRAADWWARTNELVRDSDAADRVLMASLLPSLWAAMDPLVRQPLAERLFRLRSGTGSPAAWAFAVAAYPLVDESSPIVDEIWTATQRQFRDATRRVRDVASDLGLAPRTGMSTLSKRLEMSAVAEADYETATGLFNRVESAFASQGFPTWFSFPDDLRVVEFRFRRVSRFLMARRDDDWYIVATPGTFDDLGGRRSEGGGETAGDREPSNPVGPVLSGSVSWELPDGA